MLLKLLLIGAILIQGVATVFALRLIRRTKYNSVWILFIVGFTILSAERVIQLVLDGSAPLPRALFAWLGFVISVTLSIGILYAHKLFNYIDRLNRQRQTMNKRILSAVLRTEERARSTFAKELHDGLGPLLSSAKMSLTAVSGALEDKEQRELVDNTAYMIDEAIRSLREISNNLSPHVLNDFGLARGVHNFVTRCSAMHSTRIDFTTNLQNERFDNDVEVIFYRVICELINNSLKHSGCTAIELALTQYRGMLMLEYSDNGRGFDSNRALYTGMGLSNIASRINSLNGDFSLESTPGQGMQAVVSVRLGKPKKNRQ